MRLEFTPHILRDGVANLKVIALLFVHELSADAVLSVVNQYPHVPAPIQAEIASLWDEEQGRRALPLVNGAILSTVSISPSMIVARIAEYREYLAQRVRPRLYQVLSVRPVAVSGILQCPEGLVFGRRGAAVADEVGSWELVPSGGIDMSGRTTEQGADYKLQLAAELREEIGISIESCWALAPICAVEDDVTHVLDIGVAMTTDLALDRLREAHRTAGSHEYEELLAIRLTEFDDFAADYGEKLLPVSAELVRQFCRQRAIITEPRTGGRL
jgi:hypothetical protein